MVDNEPVFADPHKKLADRVDRTLQNQSFEKKPMYQSPEIKKVEENLRFIQQVATKPILQDKHSVEVFGVKLMDPRPTVFGDNIWNRSIYTVDELCDIHDSATLEQQLKYQKRKRQMGSNMLFLLLLLGGGGLAVIVLLFLLGGGGLF